MPITTTVVCDDCGKTPEHVEGMPAPVMYVNFSHPQIGGGGMYYCYGTNDDCAAKVLNLLPGAPKPPAPEPAPTPEPTPAPSA